MQRAYGDVFVISLATAGPQVVVAAPDAVEEIGMSDPRSAHAGAARRAIVPMASERSVFGGDDPLHGSARERVASAFTADACAQRAPQVEAIAERHIGGWPRTRPFRLLERMRLLADEIFTAQVLGVRDERRGREVARAIHRLLWTPGNPPVTIPGPEDGLVGRVVDAAYRRRLRPLAALLEAEIRELRGRERELDGVLGQLVRSEPELSSAQIVDEVTALLMVAQEPIASALTWIALRASSSRAVSERLRAETIDSPYGRAVVAESLRLHPPALAMLRRLTRPLRIAGYELPAGVTAMVPIVLLHRDSRRYAEPDGFRPERHLASAEPDGRLLAFGGGARSCLGQALAQTEIATVLSVLFRELSLRPLVPGGERMVLRATILVPRRGGLVSAAARTPA
jgi:cytochrome P450